MPELSFVIVCVRVEGAPAGAPDSLSVELAGAAGLSAEVLPEEVFLRMFVAGSLVDGAALIASPPPRRLPEIMASLKTGTVD